MATASFRPWQGGGTDDENGLANGLGRARPLVRGAGSRRFFPRPSHVFVRAGARTPWRRLQASGPFDWAVGYSLGALLLLADPAGTERALRPGGEERGRVALLAPIFSFACGAGRWRADPPGPQIQFMTRRMRRDPRRHRGRFLRSRRPRCRRGRGRGRLAGESALGPGSAREGRSRRRLAAGMAGVVWRMRSAARCRALARACAGTGCGPGRDPPPRGAGVPLPRRFAPWQRPPASGRR